MNKLKSLHHKAKLNAETIKDIEWWLHVAKSWNRKSMFLDDLWYSSEKLQLETDASDMAGAGFYNKHWFVKNWSPEERSNDIAWRELYSITLACRIWGKDFHSKRILILCDNESIVMSVNKGYSKNKNIMKLIRALYTTAVLFNFDCRLYYISSIDNELADALSRLDFNRFFKKCPSADAQGVKVTKEDIDAARNCNH